MQDWCRVESCHLTARERKAVFVETPRIHDPLRDVQSRLHAEPKIEKQLKITMVSSAIYL